MTLGLAKDALRQLAMFRVDILHYGDEGLATQEEQVPAPLMDTLRDSRAADPNPMNRWLTLSTYFTALASLALLLGAGWRFGGWGRGKPGRPAGLLAEQQRFVVFASIVVAGVLTNAVVCGVLASSLDRFQARVVWLLPFLALSVLLLRRRQASSLRVDQIEASGGGAPA